MEWKRKGSADSEAEWAVPSEEEAKSKAGQTVLSVSIKMHSDLFHAVDFS